MKFPLSLAVGIIALSSACSSDDDDTASTVDYKEEMRNLVINISTKAKSTSPDFVIIPQNGIELVTQNGEDDGALHTAYLDAIDAHGQEDFLYGYDEDDVATPSSVTSYLKTFLDRSHSSGNSILITDYCFTESKRSTSYTINNTYGYLSFAAEHRELDFIPASEPYQVHSGDVNSLSDAKNFLYLLDPQNFSSRTDFLEALKNTRYDILIIDLFFHDGTSLTASEIAQLKTKNGGGKRKVIAYMSIGEAEDYRYYWQSEWSKTKPSWMDAENPNWPGNYKVKYWEADWQNIIYKNSDSYLNKIRDAGFDGVYLDIIDAFEYYE
ncbi:endo alpha-1,4 polygalactosaminidase [Ohtaekwangia koreensis]|uniref:Glycoside-hydrolase family GH114 TIM-barrel domain-containing protein n=1 Tax=Ohtaekwangia koreensis TaxID=688867 RepID=A0A1T5KPN5_9BACT|nr:endo alpha-1,4 polygalactosaminidase [Ohtaekwangia koreensis]SKC65716.1 cysteinyl-tRNA synthetase, unknown class [Ohtaekwangia koreensis]